MLTDGGVFVAWLRAYLSILLVLGSSLLLIPWLLSHSCSYIAVKMSFTPRERVEVGVGIWGVKWRGRKLID